MSTNDTVKDLITALEARGWMLATAESCTGGLIAAAITDVAGSSTIFERGMVTYSNASKVDMLGVSEATLEAYGAVSEAVAKEMARGALAQSGAQIAIAVTGIAGPGGSEEKPEGRVCFGLATEAVTSAQTVDFEAIGRAQVRAETVRYALALVLAETKHALATA